MKQHQGNVGANYHYLFLKEYLNQIKKHRQELKQLIKDNVDLEIVLELDKYPIQNQRQIFYHLFSKLKQEPWAAKIMADLSTKLLEKTKQLYEFQTQRNYFLVQNFRQTCNPPLTSSLPQNCYNLSSLFKISINKQLRRTVWLKCLLTEQNKKQFFRYDHKVIPYNLAEQLAIGMLRLGQENKLKIKENQKDCCVRLLEYVVKKWDRIPNKSQQYLAMTVVDVYAHYTPTRIMETGAVFVGLHQLAEFYFQPNVQARLQYLELAFELVDPETFKLIQSCYLPYSQKSNSDLNEVFQHFRLTLSSAFLPLGGSQYIIDQLLIKKRNKFDIYIIFSLMTMIMSDDLQKYKDAKMQLTDIINPDNTKKVIKLEDVQDAFKVIYEGVNPYHIRDSLQGNQPSVNKLLDKLIQFDEAGEIEKMGNKQESAPTSLKVIQPENKMAGFVVEDKGAVLRLGSQRK